MPTSRIPRRTSRSRYRSVSASDNLSKAIFGSFDGMTCVLGVIAAGITTGDQHALILAAIGLALAESIAMAGGTYLSEITDVHSIQHAAIIGGASLFGVLFPTFPFLFVPKPFAVAVSMALTCLLTVAIAQVRVSSLGFVRAYIQTFAIVLVAAGVSVLATLWLNGAGI